MLAFNSHFLLFFVRFFEWIYIAHNERWGLCRHSHDVMVAFDSLCLRIFRRSGRKQKSTILSTYMKTNEKKEWKKVSTHFAIDLNIWRCHMLFTVSLSLSLSCSLFLRLHCSIIIGAIVAVCMLFCTFFSIFFSRCFVLVTDISWFQNQKQSLKVAYYYK